MSARVVANSVGGAGWTRLLWGILVLALYLVGRKEQDSARLADALPPGSRCGAPDHAAADPLLQLACEVRMALLAGYLVMPVDLVPDMIPPSWDTQTMPSSLPWQQVSDPCRGSDALERHWRNG